MSTYIIAEAGVNHNGSLEMAKELVRVAKDAGADAVKFQTFKAENLVTKSAKQAAYQVENLGQATSQYDMLKQLELSYEEFIELHQFCIQQQIEFLSTPFDFESVDFYRCIKYSCRQNTFRRINKLTIYSLYCYKQKLLFIYRYVNNRRNS